MVVAISDYDFWGNPFIIFGPKIFLEIEPKVMKITHNVALTFIQFLFR